MKFGADDVDALYVGADLVDALYVGADSVLGLPAAPSGFAYLVNADDEYIVNGAGAFILAAIGGA